MKYLFYLSFFALCAILILDPGNIIHGLKEVAFVMTFITGFFHGRGFKNISSFVLTVVFVIVFFLPFWGFILGLTVGNEF